MSTSELERRYQARLESIRQGVVARVERLYGEQVSLEDLDRAFARFIPSAAFLVAAGQSQSTTAAAAYLASLITFESGRMVTLPPFEGVGTSYAGVPLTAAMAAWPAMVKEQIGKGAPPEEALRYGGFLSTRLADNEMLAAVDHYTDLATRTSGQFSGWQGTISPTACEPCHRNAGFHSIDTPMYRHGSCGCTRRFIVADSAAA